MRNSLHQAFSGSILLMIVTALSACTSAQDALEPSTLISSDGQPAAPESQPATSAEAEIPPATLAAISRDARVKFAPVIGAPANAAAALSARLSSSAAGRGISLVANGQPSANLFMQGYFSAISDGGQTIVIYVWDVTDPAGTRIHRIQGQAKAPSTQGEGWDSVQAATMEAIADETISRLLTWLASQQG